MMKKLTAPMGAALTAAGAVLLLHIPGCGVLALALVVALAVYLKLSPVSAPRPAPVKAAGRRAASRTSSATKCRISPAPRRRH